VQTKRLILSYFLLATYSLVVLHHSFAHTHLVDFEELFGQNHSHQHTHIDSDHHVHTNQVSLFHFLGHLFEQVNHQDDYGEDQLIIARADSVKEAINCSVSVDFHFSIFKNFIAEDKKTDPPDPFIFIEISSELQPPGILLRGPPSYA
jgi:hypothetical protein